jgi:septum site-determining protein MinC
LRHTGHITLIGDVNPGAEIIAGGSVVVWGRLRGLVHAGALGDSSSIICALELRPTQLRIADLIARPPDQHPINRPEFARVVAGEIIVDGWETFKR